MSSVPKGPAQGQDPSIPTTLDFTNPQAITAWLERLETVTDDGLAAGEDQLLPLDKRRLGRVVARGIVAESRAALGELIGTARRSLPTS